MSKLLHTKQVIAALMVAMTMLVPDVAWAQDSKLAVELVSFNGYFYENQEPENLLDGNPATKWCGKQEGENGQFVPFSIVVKTDGRSVLRKYELYEASDIMAYEKRDWKDWTIYGTNDAPESDDAQWTEIHRVTDAKLYYDGMSPRKNSFTISDNTSAYKFYKVEVTAIVGMTRYDVWDTTTPIEHIQMMADMDFYGSWLNDGYDEHATEVLGVSDIDSGNTHSFGLEGAENAFDGMTTNKWCGDFAQGNPYVQFTLEDNTKLNRYYLYTGNDITNAGNNRNPKEWKLYGKKNELGQWEEIAHVTNGKLTTTASTRSDDYFIAKDKQESYYKYVKFEILQVEKGNIFEVGEFRLMGTPCSSHKYTAGKVVCNVCGNILEHEHNYDEVGICTLCDAEKEIVLPFTVVQYSVGNNNEGADKAFDGITTNKWCGNTTEATPYVVMQYAGSVRPSYYYLYTGNDVTYGRKNRNPMEWKLYAKKDFDGEWTEIAHVTDAQLTKDWSTKSQNFSIDEAYQESYFQYFKFEILQVEDGDIFEVGELCIKGKPCHHEFADGSIVCSICGYHNVHKHSFDDGICTLCGRIQGSPLSLTLTQSHAGYKNEGADKAVDGITTNKWCGDNKSGTPYIVLKHDGKTKLTHYNIYTGNDVTNGSSNRNPKEWKLYAKENDASQWVEISHITNGSLPTEHSTESKDYDIHEAFLNNYYQYFKFEILQIEQGTTFEVGELILSGTACEHQCDEGSAICRLCGDVLEHEHSYDENNTCTQCGEGRALTFSIVRALSGTGDCTAEKAFDGITTNKWCGEIANGPSYVLLRHDCQARVNRYYLYTGNDIHHKESPYPDQERNPKEWKLYAKEKASDSWTMISHVNNAKLPSEFSVRSNVYDIDEAYRDKYYKFFKFEIVNAEKERMFEIGELCLIGSAKAHEYAGNTCTVCGAEKEHQHDYVQGICAKCEEYQPVEGDGTEASPYLIGNAGQLAWFRDETKLGRQGICGKLTADIDMTSVCNETIGGWVAINTYKGVFDGNNHVIKNLYINDNDLHVGLFSLNTGTIKNLGIESGTVNGQLRVGAICGFNRLFREELGQIINCFNKATVSGIDPLETHTDIGGICGWNMGGVIDRCYNTGNISGREYIGGICGASDSNGIISNCYNTGNISGAQVVGGICGKSSDAAKTISCYSIGEVKATATARAGAINGESDSKAPNNYYLNTGTEDAHGKAVTMAQFASGEVTWLLNGSVDEEDKWSSGAIDGTQAWYQKITISLDDLSSDELPFDPYPLLKRAEDGSNTVVSDCINASNKYTNGTEVLHNNIGELVAQIDAKCEEAGSKTYRLCEDCGKHLDAEGNEYKGDDWIIPATGHQYGDKIVTLQPTCTEYGEQARICSGCGAKKDISRVMPLWHNWDDGVVTKEPACTESGEMTYTCSRCDGTKTESIDPEHHYDAGVVTHEPSCSAAGEIKYTCSRCEDTYTEVIAPLPHTLDDNLKCTVCGYNVGADCIIEYTATERLSIILSGWYGEGEEVFDYTDTDVAVIDFAKEFENWGEYLFGAPAIKHEYDPVTQKGRIICSAPVTTFYGYTELRPERLTSITLPKTVKDIKGYVFDDSRNLTSITLLAEDPEETDYYLWINGCNNLQEIIVPYSAYEGYVERYGYCGSWYEDEDGTEHNVSVEELFKSLLTLDDTKAFENPTIEVKADAILQRSFANDGWYSLCLPFSVSVADSPFSQVAAFDTQDGDTYKFTTVDEIEAGKAYIVKVDAAVANPIFQNVLISTEAPANDGKFIGVYSPTELGAGCKVIGSGTTVNPANAGMMKGFRAYFPASAAGARAMRFTVDDEVTSISLPMGEGQGEAFYNTNGQRVNATHKGIVIKKGNKFVNQ